MTFSKTEFEEMLENRTIFKNRDVFTIEYLPEVYKYRDQQLKKMASFSRRIEENLAPHHMMLTGPFATGKTSTTKKFFQLLEEIYSEKVKCVHINCQFNETESEVLAEIYSKLTATQRVFKYVNTARLFGKIMNELKNQERILIIALDDYNLIKTNEELNKILYKLLRVHEQYSDAKISVFLITNNESLFAFNPNILTVLDLVTVSFDPYSYSQIYDILKQRCHAGFIKGAVNEDVLALVTDYTRDQGDLRDGIHLLAHAGEKAEINGLNIISTDYLF